MKGFRTLLFSSILLLGPLLQSNAHIVHRQLIPTATTPAPTPTTGTTSTTTSDTTTSTSATTTTSTTAADTTTSTTTTSALPTTTSTTSTSAPPQNTQNTTPVNPDPVLTTASPAVTTQTVTGQASSTSSSDPAATSTADNSNNNDNSGLGTGSIVGMSVAGGVAVIGIIAFFVWKFTRKRFSDFDDNEAIKWPDLNTHGAGASDSHPLPVNNTGRSGFDTASEGSLSRVPSTNYSTPDFNAAGADPYAVPPLPHLNPNQPYRDDPAAAGAYYDPYHGPVPGTIEHGAPGAPEWGGEAIPMTQLGGRMSPGPHAAYGAEPIYDHNAGRQSPGPQVVYGGRTSPGPQAAYGGGRMSPGPHAAYGGAMSPQPPPMAGGYDAYSGR
ncbi:hypothetical protein BJ912DRAFT_933463 [Pholiota molesta]|nr:hypothetical protein BJ912DRAFT_933463 [Pholiota molesta]